MERATGARRAKELAIASAVALALTVAFTWPLAARFSTGGRVDTGDGRYSIWNVAWVAHALTTDPQQLWNANIFYPHTGTLAFSEANIVAGVIATPMWLATENPYATSNWTIVWAFTLAAVAMFALVRHLTNNLWSAALSGVLYAFCSYSYAHLAHIQLLMTFGLPLALLRMHLFVDAPSPLRALWLGLTLALNALACGYYGMFGGLAVALGVVWFSAWSGRIRSVTFWAMTALAAVVAIAIVAPFLPPYLKIQQAGFARTLDDARIFRANWQSYLASALLAYQWLLPIIGHWREVLFPGFLSVGLTLWTIGLVIRNPEAVRRISARRVVWFYVILALLAGWASLGPDAGLYRVMYDTLPFMSLLRAPSRLGLLVTLGSAVLAGIGLATIEPFWVGPRRRVWLAALVVITLARSTVGPLEWTVAPAPTRAITWLGRLPRGAVASFPFFRGANISQETTYMLDSAWHWQPLLNGYSDFVPEDVTTDLARLVSFPSKQALRALQERQTRYVLVNWKLYSEKEQERVRAGLNALPATYRPMLNDADSSLYELVTPIADIR